jgi:SAM-dependent methyltransferase
MSHTDPFAVLDAHLDVAGRIVIDVGCGDGTLVRHLARRGASATGVEIGKEPLRRAREATPVRDERYLDGVAEDLPLEDASADAAIFIHSLHHVSDLSRTLSEVARVLRPGGTLYVEEPLAEGPYFDVLRLIDDETDVRAQAQQALAGAAAYGLDHEQRLEYDALVRHPGFDSFRDRVVLADAHRCARFADVEPALRERFDQAGEPLQGAFGFRQPMRVDILRRRPS